MVSGSQDDDFSDDWGARLAKANLVSLRAVLVADGQDPTQSLLENGILDPVSIPIVFDHDAPGGGGLNPGPTPGLTATLEQDPAEDDDWFDSGFTADGGGTQTAMPAAPPPAATTTLPPAYGTAPLAPVRRRRS